VAEEALEDARNVAEGTYVRSGMRAKEWTPLVDVAMRDEARREALVGFWRAARFFGRAAGRTQAVEL
jgi:hypothetical protein